MDPPIDFDTDDSDNQSNSSYHPSPYGSDDGSDNETRESLSSGDDNDDDDDDIPTDNASIRSGDSQPEQMPVDPQPPPQPAPQPSTPLLPQPFNLLPSVISSFIYGLYHSSDWDLTNHLRLSDYPDDSSFLFSPIDVPQASRVFKSLFRSLNIVESLFLGVTYNEQPQSFLLDCPPEIMEAIISHTGAKAWCRVMISCRQMLFLTLDNEILIGAMLATFSWFDMLTKNIGNIPNFLTSFDMLPNSLKPVQSVAKGVNVIAEALEDGCFLLRLSVDSRRLSWTQSIHSFQTERPWPIHSPNFQAGYFEVTIVTASHEYSAIGIGVAPGEFARYGQMVGWRANTYGYHSDDGGMYHNYSGWAGSHFYVNEHRAKGAPQDVIGCGVIAKTGQLFYTKNGQLMTLPDWKLPRLKPDGTVQLFHPTISLLGCGDSAVWNLGGRPFCFDLKSFVQSKCNDVSS